MSIKIPIYDKTSLCKEVLIQKLKLQNYAKSKDSDFQTVQIKKKTLTKCHVCALIILRITNNVYVPTLSRKYMKYQAIFIELPL